MKWAVLGSGFLQERYSYLNEKLKDIEPEMDVDFVEGDREDVMGALEKVKEGYQQIRIERPYRETIVESLERMTSITKTLRTADVLAKDQGRWWPRSTFHEAIVRVTAKKLKNIDLNAGVFVIGTGASARAAIAAFIKLGFSNVILTDRLVEKGQAVVADLRNTFLNIDFRFAPVEELTQLPGDRQIIFNTTPFIPSNTLLSELYYFNYMKSGGLVIDMTLEPVTPPLLKEAESVGAVPVEGCELAAWSDVLWVEMCLGKTLDYSAYLAGLRELLLEREKEHRETEK